MVFRTSRLYFFASLLFAVLGFAQTPGAGVAQVLDDWHQAAAVSDEARYFGHFARNGIFMGTDATEHWTVNAFRVWAKPAFDGKRAWKFKARDRHVDFSADGKTAWFDELLDSGTMGTCRGSGVLTRSGKTWKIAQYNLSLPVPNSLLGGIVKQIVAPPK